jgi:hypothetical protein
MKAFRRNLTGAARIKHLPAHADAQRRYVKKKNSNPR